MTKSVNTAPGPDVGLSEAIGMTVDDQMFAQALSQVPARGGAATADEWGADRTLWNKRIKDAVGQGDRLVIIDGILLPEAERLHFQASAAAAAPATYGPSK